MTIFNLHMLISVLDGFRQIDAETGIFVAATFFTIVAMPGVLKLVREMWHDAMQPSKETPYLPQPHYVEEDF